MFLWAGLLVLAATPPAALRGTVAASTGVEYDSNASRVAVEPPPPGPDPQAPPQLDPRSGPLLRALTSGTLAYAGPRQRLRLQLSLGGKVYLLPTLQDQNVGVVQLGYEHGAQLERVRLSGAVDYYDAFQAPALPEESRDLRSLQTALRLTAFRPIVGENGDRHRIEGGLDVGGQLFQYKPDPGFSFLAPSVTGRFGASLHAGDPELGHDFDLSSHARLEYRGYTAARTDVFLQLGGAATWQGPLLLQLGYTAQLNFSSKPGESFQRHLPLLKLAFRLPGDLYVTAKGQLNLLSGAAGLFQPIGNVDDDNRSLALLDLERPLPRGFALSARYTGFFSLPRDAGPSYQRHTAYLGLSYSLRLPR